MADKNFQSLSTEQYSRIDDKKLELHQEIAMHLPYHPSEIIGEEVNDPSHYPRKRLSASKKHSAS